MFRYLIAATSVLLFGTCAGLHGQDDLRTLRARAIRQAAQSVAPSVVRVEKFGVAEAAGEVADDAPTVAVAIDDQRHFIASSLVQRQTPASIVLVAEDGRRSAAKIIAADHKRQYVVLEAAEDLGVRPAELSRHETAVGQTVVAVGRIAGDGSIAVSSGVLSAQERLWGVALQTDARVSSVFYGGPLIDLRGRLLGILVPAVPDDMGEDVTAWYDAGVAFAIPADAIRERLPKLLKGEDIHDGLAGIVAKSNDPYVESTEIAAVRPRSPAARADIQAADVVLSVDGVQVRSHREIKQILGAKDAGQEVKLELRRRKETLSKTLTLAETIPPLRPQWIGITARDDQPIDKPAAEKDPSMSKDQGDQADTVPAANDQGGETAPSDSKAAPIVVTGVFTQSPADGSLEIGDIIKAIDGTPITDAQSLRRRLFSADPDAPLALTVSRRSDNGSASEKSVSIKTSDLAAQVPPALPESLIFEEPSTAWTVTDLALPDIANKSVLIAPPIDDDQLDTAPTLGLLILLADPGASDLKALATPWQASAKKAGVIVCVAAPANEAGWHPDEIDAAGRIVASIGKRYPVDSLMTVVGGAGSGPGGSMAMAVAIGRSGTFAGLAIQPDVSPPAIRLRENEPSAPLQVFLRGASNPDEPAWAAALVKNGYPVLRGDDQDETLLRWIRSLPRM
ncbi:MAG: PDZ domain-containing protein [Planctomycetaceae bacterium]